MKRKLAVIEKKRDAFTRILRFLTKDDITLSKEEDRILDRWIVCDGLLRAKILDEDGIIKKIAKQFEVSVYTARNDIYQTQQLFARSRQLIKKYLIHLHLQRIDKDLEMLRKNLFKKEVGEDGKEYQTYPDSKETMALAKLHEAYTYTLNSIPDDNVEDVQPPPIFQFILAPGQVIQRPMLLDDALKKADEILMEERDGVFVPEIGNDEE